MEKGYKKRSKNIEILSTITKEENEKKSQSASTHRHTSFDNNNNRLNHEWNGKILIKVGDCIKINFVVEIGIGF